MVCTVPSRAVAGPGDARTGIQPPAGGQQCSLPPGPSAAKKASAVLSWTVIGPSEAEKVCALLSRTVTGSGNAEVVSPLVISSEVERSAFDVKQTVLKYFTKWKTKTFMPSAF